MTERADRGVASPATPSEQRRPSARAARGDALRGLEMLGLAAVLALPFGCAFPRSARPPLGETGPAAAALDSAAAAAPVVRVRDFPGAAATTVVGWIAAESAYGLRTRVRRDGTLGGSRDGEHELYLDVLYVQNRAGFSHAATPGGLLLRRSGQRRDIDACRGGEPCSPMEITGLVLPDTLLRADRDSLVVVMHRLAGGNWHVTLPRSLIDAYLAAVDSVARRSAGR
jgi:hypothetical protein